MLRAFRIFNVFSSTANPQTSFFGLPRRAIVAAACALTLVSAGAASLSGVVSGRAEDDSNAGFWLAERARNVSRSIWSSPAPAVVEKAVAAKAANRKPGAPVYAAGNQSVCVRLCDGYFFPVGQLGGSADIASHESVCQAQCPGAATALYTMRQSNAIDTAVSARDGKPYARLAAAFLHTKAQANTCSCKPAGSSVQARLPLARDITMRRGDSVMTEKGVRIFRGKSGKTAKPADFVALAQSKDVDPQKRRMLAALERVSAPRMAAVRSPANASLRAAQPAPVSKPQAFAPANKSVRLVGPDISLVQ